MPLKTTPPAPLRPYRPAPSRAQLSPGPPLPRSKSPAGGRRGGQNGSGGHGEGAQSSGSSVGRSIFTTFFAIWAATVSCLSNAAVSLEGEIGRRVDIDGELRRHQKTTYPPKDSGITRYDFAHIASNQPAEDEHAEAILPVPSGHWSFFGIYDGHNGGDTSKWLAQTLIPAVAGALADLYARLVGDSDTTPDPKPVDIEQVMKQTFNQLDDDIVNAPVQEALASSREHGAKLLGTAWAGSCALLSFYDSHSGLLHIALTGDSRAVLGRRADPEPGADVLDAACPTKHMYSAHALTIEQSGANPDEVARITAAHPNEPNLVQYGRVLGMGVSRAFGDARLKWPRALQLDVKRRVLGRPLQADVLTPPYIHAEPEVVSVPVRPGDFLVMATDGIWECLTSEEAVGLVGMWRDLQRERAAGGKEGKVKLRDPVGGYPPQALPVWASESRDDTVRYRQWKADKRFSCMDENPATVLLRNALGGADRDLTAALLSIKTPQARSYRDDMTVLVVFFEDDA